jgi:nicotinate phosphoribosyltransferase
MAKLGDIYRPSLALLTDLYQLTMTYAHWKSGTHGKRAVFNLFFRQHPFKGGFTLACGLHRALDLLEGFRFDEADLRYLGELAGSDGQPLFEPAFLDYLAGLRLSCDVEAVPEGTVVFPHEPLLRVTGPIAEASLLETPLLNIINFETLIATKAARVCLATHGEPVIEFGLRRAQGIDGALAASRAAHVGGCAATSNVLAGRLWGIPVRGTHAHSWVMAFPSELAAFEAYAEAMPNNCVFLVDTYDSLQGVRNAIEVGRELRQRGHELAGVRLDSGDLAYLSIQARALLDAGGFPHASIVASNDLDEHVIESLKDQGARINSWGVGTQLVTAYDQPALGGVYKLAAVMGSDGHWQHKVKLSEQSIKVSTPGIQQVRRYARAGEFVADVIYDEERGVAEGTTMVDPADATRRKRLPAGPDWEDLLVPVARAGQVTYQRPELNAVRVRARQQLSGFHAGIKRFMNPHQYPVGLEARLFDLRTRLVLEARGVPVEEVLPGRE